MENLRHLIGAYFHQDWNHVYSSREDAVADLLHRSPARAAGAAEEIDLIVSSESDDQLVRRLDDLGFDDAPPEGVRAFLKAIRDQIRAASTLDLHG